MRLRSLSLAAAVAGALATGAIAQAPATNNPAPQFGPLPNPSSSSTSSATTRADVVVPGAVVVTPGVTSIDTTTSATVGSSSSPADHALLDAVVSALSSDPALRGARLTVAVREATVSITGSAQDGDQAARAKSVAAAAAGNARVEANIATE